MYELQARWNYENGILRYYGLRLPPNMLKNKIKLSASQQKIIEKLPAELSEEEKKSLGGLLGAQIVSKEEKKAVPRSLSEATFCKGCVANDYIIPGIEFSKDGLCPMCLTKKKTAHMKSVIPVMNTFPRAKRSRFDVALFYTGGKDSTYLLYYLSKVQKLRVLALTWEIPYMSESAKKSIEGAKKAFDTVEFISRRVSNDDLRTVYRRLYELSENTCACPSLAYVLFYPELCENRIPYFVAGNEPAQMTGLYYNAMAPAFVYTFEKNKWLNGLINVGRVLTFRPPLKRGQYHTLSVMKQLICGAGTVQRKAGYENPLVANAVKAIREVPYMTAPLKRALRRSSFSGNIPAFVQVDLNDVSSGTYDWRRIKDTIVRECGWVMPENDGKGLHTSCSIEKCKEHSQFKRFYNMESSMIPFSALEISLAVRDGNISREDALREMRESLGFSLCEIPECSIMKEYFLE